MSKIKKEVFEPTGSVDFSIPLEIVSQHSCLGTYDTKNITCTKHCASKMICLNIMGQINKDKDKFLTKKLDEVNFDINWENLAIRARKSKATTEQLIAFVKSKEPNADDRTIEIVVENFKEKYGL